MADNNLDKLNRLRVNAGKGELKSWKASHQKLEEAITKLQKAGFVDALPGADINAKPNTSDPEIQAARPDEPEEEEKPKLEDSAMMKNVAKEDKPEKATTRVKAHLARGLDTDQMARQSRARVRDIREQEKKDRKPAAKLSKKDKKQIKDEAKDRRGQVDATKDPAKAARQKKHIEEKQAARTAAGKTVKPREKNADEITVADIARELNIDPKVARAKLRRHEDKITPLHSKGQDRWTFPKSAKKTIADILK
jgi:hypothetical protein